MEYEKVIYRKYPDGEIIALFPQIAVCVTGKSCQSYLHVGQHGAANPRIVIRQTKPAKPKECAKLHKELSRQGYKLRVFKRFTRNDLLCRREQLLGVVI